MFEDISFVELEEKHKEDEGLVLVGCGGEPEEWFEGVSGLLNDAKISPNGRADFGEFYKMVSTGGRMDLVMMFGEKNELDIGRFAMWRLNFGDASWLSDFFVNYRKHYIEE